jgi:large subunit ribosomal protein L21
MIAVVELGGKQYTVEVGMSIVVDRQQADVGTTLELSALLIADSEGKSVQIGTPMVAGSKVSLTVDEHTKADKVRVFKMKAKKRYTRTHGFRAMQTRLTVTAIA